MAKSRTTSAAVLLKLKAQANPKVRAAMARFGVHVKKAHGISTPVLHKLAREIDRKSTRLNSSHGSISYAVFCLKKKKSELPARGHRGQATQSFLCVQLMRPS